MSGFKKIVLVAVGFLVLLKISPLGAAVAVATCIIKCLFKSRTFSHLAALILHDLVCYFARCFWWVLRNLSQGLWNSLRVMSRVFMRWVTKQTS